MLFSQVDESETPAAEEEVEAAHMQSTDLEVESKMMPHHQQSVRYVCKLRKNLNETNKKTCTERSHWSNESCHICSS